MKKLTLLIDDDVFKELKNSLAVSMIAGTAYGIQDAFILKIIKSVDNKETELEIKFKDKK